MRVKLKRIQEQVIVITGASSGIGLATARMAADRGARVVLTSRDDVDLRHVVEDIRAAGGQAIQVAGDVADLDAMKRVAATAVGELGAIDTWVNNAGVSIFGRLEETGTMDARRLFETNYWGVVHGTLAALPHLRAQGGALINLGSVLSDTGYPLQGHYTASKHAVKGFTDSLRLELEQEGAPVSVTLIQPAAIDTPYPEHAKSYLGVEPRHVPPVYALQGFKCGLTTPCLTPGPGDSRPSFLGLTILYNGGESHRSGSTQTLLFPTRASAHRTIAPARSSIHRALDAFGATVIRFEVSPLFV